MGKLLQILRFYSITLFLMVHIHASVSSPLPIDINSTISGAISVDSEISPHSNNKSEYYTFTLTEETNIVISMESDFYHKIYLLESNGTVIKEASKYDYLNDKIVMTLAQGSYIIDVTSVFSDNYGAFTLSLQESVIKTHVINMDTILDDEWTSSSGISPRSMQFANYYTFTLLQDTDILIDLEGTHPYVYLVDHNNTVIASAGTVGGGHAKIVTKLAAGTYMIDATKEYYSDSIGVYTLRFKTNNITTTQIELNSTIEDAWNLSSGVSPRSKQYTNYYTFTLDEAKDLFIGIQSNVAKEIYLLDENNILIQKTFANKDMFIHLEAGIYMIDVSSVWNTGNYTLTFRENIISNTLIDLNTTLQMAWNNTSGYSPLSHHYSNYYTFTLERYTEISIYLNVYNAALYLLDENGNKIPMIGGGNILATGLDAGTYIIDATQFSSMEQVYEITLKENIVKMQEITFNSIVESQWDEDDGISSKFYGYAKQFTFTLDKQTDIVIELNSTVDMNHLSLWHKENSSELLAFVYGNRMVISLEAGEYVVETGAGDLDIFLVGHFSLRIRENNFQKEPIVLNIPTLGEWTINSGVKRGDYTNQYVFSLAERTRVLITLKSQYSKYIKIDGESFYMHSEEDLLVYKVLDKGMYVVDISINDWNNPYQIGRYELLIEADVEHPSPINALITLNVGAHSTTITWEKGNDSTVGYKIYLNGTFITEVDASKNSYTLSGLNPESQYEYSVMAYNSAGESEAVKGQFTTKKDDFSWLIPINQMILN